ARLISSILCISLHQKEKPQANTLDLVFYEVRSTVRSNRAHFKVLEAKERSRDSLILRTITLKALLSLNTSDYRRFCKSWSNTEYGIYFVQIRGTYISSQQNANCKWAPLILLLLQNELIQP